MINRSKHTDSSVFDSYILILLLLRMPLSLAIVFFAEQNTTIIAT
jgi:hypothetical protein